MIADMANRYVQEQRLMRYQKEIEAPTLFWKPLQSG